MTKLIAHPKTQMLEVCCDLCQTSKTNQLVSLHTCICFHISMESYCNSCKLLKKRADRRKKEMQKFGFVLQYLVKNDQLVFRYPCTRGCLSSGSTTQANSTSDHLQQVCLASILTWSILKQKLSATSFNAINIIMSICCSLLVFVCQFVALYFKTTLLKLIVEQKYKISNTYNSTYRNSCTYKMKTIIFSKLIHSYNSLQVVHDIQK